MKHEKEENNFTDEDTPVCTIECGCSAASSEEYEERHKECMEKNREYIPLQLNLEQFHYNSIFNPKLCMIFDGSFICSEE